MALATLFTAAIVLAASPATSAPATSAAADWTAQARAGRVACMKPDVAKKSCASLARYTFTKGGKVEEAAETLASPEPLITFRTRRVFELRAGAACGTMTQKDLDAAVFFVKGKPAPRQMSEQLRDALNGALFDYLDRDMCMSFVPSGTGFEARISVNGLEYTHLSEPVIWVRPNERYAVKPESATP